MKTKTIISLFLFLLLFFKVSLHSQNTSTIGIKGGAVFNQYIVSSDGMTNYGTNYRNGIMVGITSELFKSKHFMLMPEIFYIQRGTSGDDYAPDNRKSSISYLSIMILPSYRIQNKLLTPFFYVGPRIEFIINYNNGDFPNFYDGEHKTNIGFTSGLGISKEITKKIETTLEFRYSKDFTGFRRVYTIDGQFANYTNSSFDLQLGLNFDIGSSKK